MTNDQIQTLSPALNQRWRDRRAAYRPAGEPIRTADYEVAPIAGDDEARAFAAPPVQRSLF